MRFVKHGILLRVESIEKKQVKVNIPSPVLILDQTNNISLHLYMFWYILIISICILLQSILLMESAKLVVTTNANNIFTS